MPRDPQSYSLYCSGKILSDCRGAHISLSFFTCSALSRAFLIKLYLKFPLAVLPYHVCYLHFCNFLFFFRETLDNLVGLMEEASRLWGTSQNLYAKLPETLLGEFYSKEGSRRWPLLPNGVWWKGHVCPWVGRLSCFSDGHTHTQRHIDLRMSL